jgi:hypothetical protein
VGGPSRLELFSLWVWSLLSILVPVSCAV